MGVVDGPALLRPVHGFTDTLAKIWEDDERFPKNGPDPIVGVDVSVFMVPASKTKGALQEMFMEPKVPVMSVSEYLRLFCLLLKRNKFSPLLVFDGQRSPIKKETTDKRYQHLEDDIKMLENMYRSDIEEGMKLQDIEAQQKKSSSIREDVKRFAIECYVFFKS